MYNDWFSIGKITIHGYGVMIGLGFLTAVMLCYYRAKKKGMNHDAILDLALWCVLGGFVGAKALYLIVEWKTFIANPLSAISGGGFVLYGGVITGVLIGLAICRIKKISFFEYFNMIAPQIALAQGLGRIGCFFAGCCYGAPTDSFLGITFPAGGIAPAGVKLWPTQLMMSAGDFLIAGLLYLLERNEKCKNHIGAIYMILYGVGRFCMEFFRSDARGSVGVLSTSQFISIFIILGGTALLVLRLKGVSKFGKKTAKAEKSEK